MKNLKKYLENKKAIARNYKLTQLAWENPKDKSPEIERIREFLMVKQLKLELAQKCNNVFHAMMCDLLNIKV